MARADSRRQYGMIKCFQTEVSMIKKKNKKKNIQQDFRCGPVVGNPPAKAGDTGLITGLGRFLM